jgi:3-hydroxy-9,10-secoandrosta-1,3,5(10)-triene-9,17-dione monooxygenase
MSKAVFERPPGQAQSGLAAELLDRAAGLVPALREREKAANTARQVPTETISDFADAGFFKVLQPARYGGYELSPSVYCEIARTLAEGCMSSAWVYSVIAVHNWQLALFDDRAAQDVWGCDRSTRISSSYMPAGKVRRVDGGVRLIAIGSSWAAWRPPRPAEPGRSR